jgi:hypothetical protein
LAQVTSRRYAKAIKGEHMLPEKQKSAYEQFYESTAKNELLDPKTTVMIQLAVSFVIGCYP